MRHFDYLTEGLKQPLYAGYARVWYFRPSNLGGTRHIPVNKGYHPFHYTMEVNATGQVFSNTVYCTSQADFEALIRDWNCTALYHYKAA